jgi:hypothetical protein
MSEVRTEIATWFSVRDPSAMPGSRGKEKEREEGRRDGRWNHMGESVKGGTILVGTTVGSREKMGRKPKDQSKEGERERGREKEGESIRWPARELQ